MGQREIIVINGTLAPIKRTESYVNNKLLTHPTYCPFLSLIFHALLHPISLLWLRKLARVDYKAQNSITRLCQWRRTVVPVWRNRGVRVLRPPMPVTPSLPLSRGNWGPATDHNPADSGC